MKYNKQLFVETPTDKSISTQALINWIERFKARFEKKTRRRLMLYTGVFFVEIYNNFFIPNKGYPLKNMILCVNLIIIFKVFLPKLF